MSYTEVEEFELDDDSLSNEETNHETGEDDTPEDKSKNTSNFKKLYKKAQEAETRAEKAERLAEELAEQIEAWKSGNPDIVLDKQATDKFGAMEEKIFLVANPEAKAHFDKVKARVKQYGMPMEEAWDDIRLRLPKESVSTEDFSIKWKQRSDKIDYTKVRMEDTAEYTPAQRKAWREANNWK